LCGYRGAEILLPQTRLAVAVDSLALSGGSRAAAGAALTLLQEGLQELGKASPAPGAVRDSRSEDVTFHTNVPPPPFRGAQPTAQSVALPSLPPDAPLATTAHHLLGDTDAAIARQTLLQVASLPDRVDASTARIDLRRRAGISKFRLPPRRGPHWRSSKFPATAAAAKPKPPGGYGGRGFARRRTGRSRACAGVAGR
jgi:hypothetical protein